jgi:hypothetical protein
VCSNLNILNLKKCNNEKNVMMIVNPISGAIDKSDFVLATQRFSHQENLTCPMKLQV